MKKALYLILLFLTVVGILGGIGYTIYYHAYVISVGVAGLTLWLFQQLKITLRN